MKYYNAQTLVVFGSHAAALPFEPLRKTALSEHPAPPAADPASLLLVLYSSGTTGMPKGVMLSHRNVVAFMTAASAAPGSDVPAVVMGTAPFTHASGICMVIHGFSRGDVYVILSSPDPSVLIPAIAKHKGTFMFQFPTYLRMLLRSPLFDKYDLSSLKVVSVGGSTTPPELAAEARAKLKLYALGQGDMGYYDKEGLFYITDRVKDLIKCMDQQVPPAELEGLLLQHDAVQEAAVVGVAHDDYGEAARAFVVLRPGHEPSADVRDALLRTVAGPSPRKFGMPDTKLPCQSHSHLPAYSQGAVIEDGVVRSSMPELPVPDIDFVTHLRNTWQKFRERTALLCSLGAPLPCTDLRGPHTPWRPLVMASRNAAPATTAPSRPRLPSSSSAAAAASPDAHQTLWLVLVYMPTLMTLRQAGQYCDVKFRTSDGGVLLVHRFVLADSYVGCGAHCTGICDAPDASVGDEQGELVNYARWLPIIHVFVSDLSAQMLKLIVDLAYHVPLHEDVTTKRYRGSAVRRRDRHLSGAK
ncbi:hypothetical protein HPB48_002259 [Haemaphysalis longicornis]|uniref:Uncharacterized protein n=1 Tax=Haemaphysalis longicornis TaxID=44386 RepID=A0A9J6FIW7_HAELO|nr:hypothetical protein HPB48_002259 [Haemaphysalis longicornis]